MNSSASAKPTSDIAPKSAKSKSLFDQLPAARMNAEGGYDEISASELPPLRWSGLLCLILGVLSFSATVAIPMLIVPVLALIVGAIALRKYQGKVRPVGTAPAVIGLILAAGFGACGVAIPYLKHRTLGDQAVQFSRQYLEVVAMGNLPMALELQKNAANRQLETTNIDEYYAKAADEESSREHIADFRTGLFGSIHAAGDKPEWELVKVSVFQKYGNEKVLTHWIDKTGTIKEKVEIEMQWLPGQDGQTADWHVTLFHVYREPIFAPRVT